MNHGQVILLNGTSSAGKTSIAKLLQLRFAEPYLHISLDVFYAMCPAALLDPSNVEEVTTFSTFMPRMISGFHRSVAALAEAGNNVIVDHVLEEDGWLQECVRLWADLQVCFVGVKCPLEVAQQRELARGDRSIGLVRHQYPRVHRHDLYDVEVDTSQLSAEECANQIIKHMEIVWLDHSQSAFKYLNQNFVAGDRESNL